MTLEPIIRAEQPGDIEIISQITELAFQTLAISQHTEQFIIRDLRRSGALSISLVAQLDQEVVQILPLNNRVPNGQVTHHEAFNARS